MSATLQMRSRIIALVSIVLAFFLVALGVLAAESWPGGAGTRIADSSNLGAGYEPSGLVYHSVRNELIMVGDDGDVTTMNTDGSNVNTVSPGGDLEGVTIADTSTNLVYVGVEHPDAIKEYDLEAEAYTGNQWTLTAWMTGANNQGLEALTFVPNGAHPYANSDSGGLFYGGLQADGTIFVFDVDLDTSESVSYIDTITVNASRTDISGLTYNADTELLYVVFDSFNEVVEFQLDETVVNTYTLPGNAQEGIDVVTTCPAPTSATFYIGEDTGPEVWTYADYAVTCQEEDEGGGDEGGDPVPDEGGDEEPDTGEEGDEENGNDEGGESDDGGDSGEDESGGDDEGETGGDEGDGGIDTSPEQESSVPLLLAAAAGPGGGPHVRLFESGGTWEGTQFYAYGEEFRGGVRLASGDVDGDGVDELITGPGRGGGPHVRVFERDGTPTDIQFFAFHPEFHGGIDVAAGDTDGDGVAEIAVCQYSDGQAWVKVYKYNAARDVVGEWNAFGAPEVGCTVAMGDVDGDGEDEIVVGAGNGGGPQVRVFEDSGRPTGLQFFAFHPDSRSGVDVAVADTNGDGVAEIAVAQLLGQQAWTKLYNTRNTVLAEFNAFGTPEVGANIELLDIPGYAGNEIIVGANIGGGPQVRAFNTDGTGIARPNFFPFDTAFRGGVSVVGMN